MADDAMAIDSDHDVPATAAAAAPPPAQQQQQRRASMTENEQKERRASIQAIMKDRTLTPVERRKSIQQLMDGRRRSSTASGGGGGMAAAAAAAAAFYTSSSDSDDSDSDAEMGGASSSMGSSMASAGGQQQQHPGGAVGSRFHRRSSLRNSFINSVSQMTTGNGGGGERRGSEGVSAGDGTLAAAQSGPSHSLLGRRDSALSAASSASGHHHLGSAIGSSRKMEKRRPHCDHYDRKCTIISPCCGLAFGCRICHDDCPVLPPPIFGQVIASGTDGGGGGVGTDGVIGSIVVPNPGGHDSDAGMGPSSSSVEGRRRINRSASMPSNFTEEETHHEIDRFAIREVICRVCYCRQSSKTYVSPSRCSVVGSLLCFPVFPVSLLRESNIIVLYMGWTVNVYSPFSFLCSFISAHESIQLYSYMFHFSYAATCFLAIPIHVTTVTSAQIVASSLESITATSATYGCQRKRSPTTAPTAAFVA